MQLYDLFSTWGKWGSCTFYSLCSIIWLSNSGVGIFFLLLDSYSELSMTFQWHWEIMKNKIKFLSGLIIRRLTHWPGLCNSLRNTLSRYLQGESLFFRERTKPKLKCESHLLISGHGSAGNAPLSSLWGKIMRISLWDPGWLGSDSPTLSCTFLPISFLCSQVSPPSS